MRKLIRLLGLAGMVGVASSASATTSILFDIDGAGAGGATAITAFDWSPDNALSKNSIDQNGFRNSAISQLYAQAQLASFKNGGSVINNSGPYQFTFQTSFEEFGVNAGGGTVAFFTTGNSTTAANFFRIYADTSANANDKTGGGYGADGTATLIYSGIVQAFPGSGVVGTSTYTEAFFQPTPLPGLDQNLGDGDDDGGVTTRVGQGSATIEVLTTYANPDFFKSAFTILTLDFTTQLNLPFLTANPSDQVVGQTPVYGAGNVNGAACTPATGAVAVCDFHLQQDASSGFNVTQIPEPASLALIASGLLVSGFAARGRRGRTR